MHKSQLVSTLSSVALGLETTHRNLTMYPLLRRGAGGGPANDYATLDEGLASGEVVVTEISEHGSVPELRVVNRGRKPLLVVDGEELVGAKQNRIVNLTILVPAESELTIPVSCVEAGRWRHRSRTFASAPRTQYASGRAKRMAQVTDSMQMSGRYRSDQAEVWSHIAEKSARLRTPSPTGAMEAIFTGHAPFIDSCVAALKPSDAQIGALFVVGGRVVGFDLFDREATLRKLLPKLVQGVAVDALDSNPDSGDTSIEGIPLRSLCEQFVAAVGQAPTHSAQAIGLGQDVRLTAQGLTGAALVVSEQVIHLSAFSQ